MSPRTCDGFGKFRFYFRLAWKTKPETLKHQRKTVAPARGFGANVVAGITNKAIP